MPSKSSGQVGQAELIAVAPTVQEPKVAVEGRSLSASRWALLLQHLIPRLLKASDCGIEVDSRCDDSERVLAKLPAVVRR